MRRLLISTLMVTSMLYSAEKKSDTGSSVITTSPERGPTGDLLGTASADNRICQLPLPTPCWLWELLCCHCRLPRDPSSSTETTLNEENQEISQEDAVAKGIKEKAHR